MKKAISFLLCLVLTLCVTACRGTPPPVPDAPDVTPAPPPGQEEPDHTHAWKEATYESPKTCTVCGETEGEPLTPGFIELGCSELDLDTAYEYSSVGMYDNTRDQSFEEMVRVTGNVTVRYEIVEGNEKYPAKEGYEWRVANVLFVFDSTESNDYGYRYLYFSTDFHAMAADSDISLKQSGDGELYTLENTYDVHYDGKDYEIGSRTEKLRQEWVPNDNGYYTAYVEFEKAFQVPAGYSGIVIACVSPYAYIEDAGNYDETLESETLGNLIGSDARNALFFILD